MHINIEAIEEKSGLGTLIINKSYPFVIDLEKIDYKNIQNNYVIKYNNQEVSLTIVGTYHDYEAVMINEDENESSVVWKPRSNDAKFYLSKAAILFSGLVVMPDNKINLYALEFISGKIRTVSSIQGLNFSEKSVCVVFFLKNPLNPNEGLLEETYQYINSDWVLVKK